MIVSFSDGMECSVYEVIMNECIRIYGYEVQSKCYSVKKRKACYKGRSLLPINKVPLLSSRQLVKLLVGYFFRLRPEASTKNYNL